MIKTFLFLSLLGSAVAVAAPSAGGRAGASSSSGTASVSGEGAHSYRPSDSVAAPSDGTHPGDVLFRDLFSGTGVIGSGSERICQPGPGVWSGRIVAKSGTMALNNGELVCSALGGAYDSEMVCRTPLLPFAGLTMLCEGRVSGVAEGGADFACGLSPAPDDQNVNGSICIRGDYDKTSIDLCITPGGGSNGSWRNFAHVYQEGDRFAMAVRFDSAAQQSYWAQGGLLEQFGAVPGSSTWFPVGISRVSATTSLYPYISTQTPQGTQSHFYRAELRSSWASDGVNQLLDYGAGYLGVHEPMIAQLPDGRLITVWDHGSSHSSSDIAVMGSVRQPDGTWTSAQTLMTPLYDGYHRTMLNTSRVGREIWMCYAKVSDVDKTSTSYYRKLSVAGDGGIAVGPELSFASSNSVPVCCGFGRIFQRKGRTFMPFQDRTHTWVAYSDDLVKWKPVLVSPPSLYTVEASVIAEPTSGKLACYMRTDNYVYYLSESSDNGQTWSPPAATGIPCPQILSLGLNGTRCLLRETPDGHIALIGNDFYTDRRKLTVWVLGDGGQILHKMLIGDLGDACHLQYPDLYFDGANLLIAVSIQSVATSGIKGDAANASSAILLHQRKWLSEPPPMKQSKKQFQNAK